VFAILAFPQAVDLARMAFSLIFVWKWQQKNSMLRCQNS
jgi:hypothetical protein